MADILRRQLHWQAFIPSRPATKHTMKRLFFKPVVLLVLLAGVAFTAGASIDVHEFETEADREQYQNLLRVLRCPKCQNQNLEDSDATLAMDLRREVARLINEGQTDEQVKEYMVNRYGDFVLYEPPVQSNTWLLWWSPVFMLGTGALIFAIIVINRRRFADQVVEDEAPDNDVAEDTDPVEADQQTIKE